jgi:hypothetical protein
MLYLISKIIVGLIALSSLLYFIFVLFSHSLDLKRQNISDPENLHAVRGFFHTLDILAKFFIKQIVKRYHFIIHYVLFVILQFFTLIKLFTNFVYNKTRKYFIKKSIQNESHLVYFWDYLKKYKKEIDKEKDLSQK